MDERQFLTEPQADGLYVGDHHQNEQENVHLKWRKIHVPTAGKKRNSRSYFEREIGGERDVRCETRSDERASPKFYYSVIFFTSRQ